MNKNDPRYQRAYRRWKRLPKSNRQYRLLQRKFGFGLSEETEVVEETKPLESIITDTESTLEISDVLANVEKVQAKKKTSRKATKKSTRFPGRSKS